MKILILLPVRNKPSAECLGAVFNQTEKDFGLLIERNSSEGRHKDKMKEKCISIVHARNSLRKQALKTDAEWFLWLDSDVLMPPNALRDFLKIGRPFMGGWYKKKSGNDWVSASLVKGTAVYHHKQPCREIIETDLVGLGCAMMSREILEKLDFEADIDTGYSNSSGHKFFAGECLNFTRRAEEFGPVMVPIVCAHISSNNF